MDPQQSPPPDAPAPAPTPEPAHPHTPSCWPWVVILLLTAGGMFMLWYSLGEPPSPSGLAKSVAAPAAKNELAPAILPPAPSQQGPVVGVAPEAPVEQPAIPSSEQVQRNEPYGSEKSLNAVVRFYESIKLSDKTVPIAELERKPVVEGRGVLLDKPLGNSQQITAWGVHALRPSDSLWKIHYALLREYLAHRKQTYADQPTRQGIFSGVGKVLKFAEHMVGMYNLKIGHMSCDLDLLEPGEKMVAFNLSEIFDQLPQIEPKDLDEVIYDSRVLLFPKREKLPAQSKP
ncbi:Soluble ligand binding domain-containing protein [Desulfarculales bacterium]